MDYKKRWLNSYRDIKKPPHWALDLEPSKFAEKFVAALKKRKLKEYKILEIGCGNGRDSLFFAENGFNVTSIDISQNALILAGKNKQAYLFKNTLPGDLTFHQADAEALPFKDEKFDAVYSLSVLHSADLKKSFEQIYRVLKIGGVAWLHLGQKTFFLTENKIEEHCSPEKLKSVLNNLPFKILEFKSDIAMKKIDYDDEEKNPHRHFAIIVKLKK